MQIGDRTTIAGIVLGAAVALGTVAVPTSFWDTHETLRLIALSGSGALIVACIAYLCYLHMDWRSRVLYPILLMIIGGLGFFAGAIWLGMAQPGTSAIPAPTTTPWKHSLEDLYNSDFQDLGSAERTLETKIHDPSSSNSATLPSRFRLYYDFRSNTDFISIFVPTTNNVFVDESDHQIIER
jgi:hypothetical protein